jgi:hypothetical protein
MAKMSTQDERLAQRALAAAAADRAKRAKEQADLEQWSKQRDAEERARLEQDIITSAIPTLKKILGRQTTPADWEIYSEYLSNEYDSWELIAARTTVLGVEITTGGAQISTAGLVSNPSRRGIDAGKYLSVRDCHRLTLVSFGEALEAARSPDPGPGEADATDSR